MKYIKRTTTAAVLCFFCVCLMYLEFFNHPPADDTLVSNLEHIESDRAHRAPRFHHLQLGGAGDVAGRGLRSRLTTDASQQPGNNKERWNNRSSNDDQSENGKRQTSVPLDAPQKEETENAQIIEINSNGERDVRNSSFDWDSWVKDKGYVDIGTIWANCDNERPEMVGKVTLEKDQEHGGLKYNMDMNATILEEVSSGKIVFDVELDGVHFMTKHFDICDSAIKYGWDAFHCPIQQGSLFFHYDKHIPAYIPSGEYYGESKTTDQSERTIICGQFKLKL